MFAYNFDVGNELGFLEATVEFALQWEDLREELLKYLFKITEKETKGIKLYEVEVSET